MNENKNNSSRMKIFCLFAIAGALQFIIITFIAMLAYPDGYNFIGHYFSDLGTIVTRNGVPNPISRTLFVIASVIAGFALIDFWILVSILFRYNLLIKVLSWRGSILGIISAPLLMLLAIYAADKYLIEHIFTTVYFFILFALAIFIYSIAILINKNYSNIYAIISIAFSILILLFIFGFFMFMNVLMQKIVIYGFCAWTAMLMSEVWKFIK
ncbi:MAG: hypothetical protein ACTSXH_19360 [Promethearchaeota archaeon]